MLTIYFSPHMTSTDNEAGRASGFVDVPLSAAGEQKSRELGQHYDTYALDLVFCSDLQRAVETARIAFMHRPILVVGDERLRETNYGALTQAPVETVDAVLLNHIKEPFPNGESLTMAVQRMGDFLHERLREAKGKAYTFLVIGHRATKYALEYWCGDQTLETIVRIPWEWRDIPIWRYQLAADSLDRRTPIT